ncbi:hypothetical protein E2P81_ATG07394 [Venturia nashicola]|nr:hypothetical protein E2P81_ATG07394 [Venturia nashicola]
MAASLTPQDLTMLTAKLAAPSPSETTAFDRILLPEWRQSEKVHPGRSFIDLPRELRDMIYWFFLRSWEGRIRKSGRPSWEGRSIGFWRSYCPFYNRALKSDFSSLMSVSRQVHEEASSVAYQEMTCLAECSFTSSSIYLPLLAPHYASLVRRGSMITTSHFPTPLKEYSLQKVKQRIWAICEATSRYPNLESCTIDVPMTRVRNKLAREPMWNQWKALWEADKDSNFEHRLELFDQMLNDFGDKDRLFPCFVRLVLCGKWDTPWGSFNTDVGRAFRKDFQEAFARREKEKASKVTKAARKKKRTQMLTKDNNNSR